MCVSHLDSVQPKPCYIVCKRTTPHQWKTKHCFSSYESLGGGKRMKKKKKIQNLLIGNLFEIGLLDARVVILCFQVWTVSFTWQDTVCSYHPYALVHTAFFLNSARDLKARSVTVKTRTNDINLCSPNWKRCDSILPCHFTNTGIDSVLLLLTLFMTFYRRVSNNP